MSNIWVREFTGGLDARRLPETTAGGVLIKARNGHITRGGEFQKRKAFVETYNLPAGTVAMAAGKTSIYVFGSGPTPAGIPAGVIYQRLQHPDGVTDLADVLSAELNAGRLYVAAEFADGSIFHFYNGARVTDWFDGRARARFTVQAGSVGDAKASSGSFEVLGGTGTDALTALRIDGVNILGGTVTHTGNNATTAAAIAASINTAISTPDYTATSNGQLVLITAVTVGTGVNGKAIVPTTSGSFAVGNITTMSGGAAATPGRVTDITVDGRHIIGAPIAYSTTATQLAQDIADAVNSFTSSPEYEASASGNSVAIIAAASGSSSNGYAVTFTTSGDLTITPSAPGGAYAPLANGSDLSGSFQPGDFVKTISKKMYSTSGPNLHFSGIAAPKKWTTDAVGAGFIDMSSESSGAETLTAVAKYQDRVAVFAERVVQIWYMDPDPTLNRWTQTLENTGTFSGRSVTQFGDNDLFYLDESGLRSLRARDASNAAATNDVGVLIDPLIIKELQGMTLSERKDVVGLIEPQDSRFWLALKNNIYVFSFYPGAKVSAWTTYEPTIIGGDGNPVTLPIDNICVYQRRVYLRSGNTIYVYGGLTGDQYDETEAEAWTPYLDASNPSQDKQFTGIDAALTGDWSISAATQPTDSDAEDLIGVLSETTYNGPGVGAFGRSTHISLRCRTTSPMAATLSSLTIHFTADGNEDK